MSSHLLMDVLEEFQQAKELCPEEVKQYRSSIRRLSRLLGRVVSVTDTVGPEFKEWFVQNLKRQGLSTDLARDFAGRIKRLGKVSQAKPQSKALSESEVV